MATSTSTASAIAALKSRPDFLRVHLTDDSVSQVAVPNVKRWKSRTVAIIESMPWESFEPLDAKGNVVGARQENGEAHVATDLEDLEDLPESATNAQVAGLVSIMLRAQQVALQNQAKAYDSVLHNNQKLLEVMTARLAGMEKSAYQNFQMIADLHSKVNAANASEEGVEGEVLGAVAKVLLEGQVKKASEVPQ